MLLSSSQILKLTTHFKNYDEVLVSITLFFNCISFQVGKSYFGATSVGRHAQGFLEISINENIDFL